MLKCGDRVMSLDHASTGVVVGTHKDTEIVRVFRDWSDRGMLLPGLTTFYAEVLWEDGRKFSMSQDDLLDLNSDQVLR